jgi:isocitrate dehydrogenase
MITNRGQKVYPNVHPDTFCSDHWRCRYQAPDGKTIDHAKIIDLLQQMSAAGFDFIKTENLYNFDGAPGFAMA